MSEPHKISTKFTARLVLGIALGVTALIFFSPLFTTPLSAQEYTPKEDLVIVAKVDGLLDGIVADFLKESIQDAESDGALAFVLQVNSSGKIISDSDFEELLETISTAQIPVASWVGPSGARATNEIAELVLATEPIGISPGARIGNTDSRPELLGHTVGYEESLELGIVDYQSPTVGDLLLQLNGFNSVEVKADEDCVRDCLIYLEPTTSVRFTRLSFLDQAMHTVASPPVAYLLFSFGLGLIILEYFTAGVGISGVVGAGSFILGAYGLVSLPTNLWAVVLLLLGIFGYAVDIQTGVARIWTFIATVSFVVGSLFLYHSDIEFSWIILLIGIGSMAGGMIGALPILVRSRFTAPTNDRDWIIGEIGSTLEDLNPKGKILIGEGVWLAKTYGSTSIPAGKEVEITGLDDLILEVEKIN